MKEKDLGQQMRLAGIVVARSHRGPEPSFPEREKALQELESIPDLHSQVLEIIARLAPFGEHRDWARARLASPPAMAVAGARR